MKTKRICNWGGCPEASVRNGTLCIGHTRKKIKVRRRMDELRSKRKAEEKTRVYSSSQSNLYQTAYYPTSSSTLTFNGVASNATTATVNTTSVTTSVDTTGSTATNTSRTRWYTF